MKNNRGFTLVEMMISVAIFSIVMAGIYQTYDSQQKTYIIQEQVIDMQQNQRTALYFLGQDLRMAGYDPTLDMASPGFDNATIGGFTITMDLNGDKDHDNDTNEIIRYALNNGTDGISDAIDKTGDWINSGAECSLGRETGGAGGLQPVADNIDAIEFLYILEDGTVTEEPTNNSERAEIRGVTVSILARTKNMIKGYLNDKEYRPASYEIDNSTWGPFDDSYRRNLYITTFKCRNMGRNPIADMYMPSRSGSF
jgi:type IV pilus assembly protein PilW